MVRLIALLLTVLTATQAQTINATTSTPTVVQGQSFTVNVNEALTNSAAAKYVLGVPAGFTLTSSTAGAVQIGKQLICGPNLPLICLVIGANPPNKTTMPTTGLMGAHVLKVPVTQPVGDVTIPLTGLQAVDPTGTLIVVTPPIADLKITVVKNKYDITGNGVVDQADVNLVMDQVKGLTTCTTGDVNGDGKCDLYDAFATVLAALGTLLP